VIVEEHDGILTHHYYADVFGKLEDLAVKAAMSDHGVVSVG